MITKQLTVLVNARKFVRLSIFLRGSNSCRFASWCRKKPLQTDNENERIKILSSGTNVCKKQGGRFRWVSLESRAA